MGNYWSQCHLVHFIQKKNVLSRDHFRKLCKLCHFVDVLFRCIRIYKYKGGLKLGM